MSTQVSIQLVSPTSGEIFYGGVSLTNSTSFVSIQLVSPTSGEFIINSLDCENFCEEFPFN
jgi:hypothetical protein